MKGLRLRGIAIVTLVALAVVIGCEASAASPPRGTSPVPTVQPTATHAVITPEPSPSPTASSFSTGPDTHNSMFGPITCDSLPDEAELSHHIYDPAEFDALVPMGRMWGSHVTPTDHLYFQLHEKRERGFVRTPADGTIVSIQRFPNDRSPFWDNSLVEPDLRVVIAHTCELFSVYIHLGELAPEIAAHVGEIERGQNWFLDSSDPLIVRAGQPIAMFGGSAVDYSLHDESVTLSGFQVPEHYDREPWKVHTVDPFDYMTDKLVSELLPKNERQVSPYGGKIDYDIKGTAVGNWFMDGTVDYSGGPNLDSHEYWTGHLSIAYDHVEPSQIRISIGRDIGLTTEDCRICGGVYAVHGNGPDPATVLVESGTTKYELTGRKHSDPDSREKTVNDGNILGIFLVQVIDETSIRTEFVKDVSASETTGFSENAVIYRR